MDDFYELFQSLVRSCFYIEEDGEIHFSYIETADVRDHVVSAVAEKMTTILREKTA